MRLGPSALVLALLLPGCSYAFVQPYHEPATATSEVHCTSAHTSPLVDTTITVLATAATVYLVARPADAMPADAPGSAGAAGLTSLVALGYGTSAIYGFWHVSTCRAEKQRAE